MSALVTLRSSLRARQRIGGVPVVISAAAHEPGAALVQLRSDEHVPSDFFSTLRSEMSARGCHRVRSNAIAERFIDAAHRAGFEVAQRLVLLRRDMHGADGVANAFTPDDDRGDGRHGVDGRVECGVHGVIHSDEFTYRGPTPRSRLAIEECARVDAVSFAESWSLDAAALRDAATATPRHRFVVSRVDDTVVGFVLSGADSRYGFIQRLAVDPTARNHGVATSLLTASLRWLSTPLIETTWVNTEPTNEAALRLYARVGFHRHHEGLVVVEWNA